MLKRYFCWNPRRGLLKNLFTGFNGRSKCPVNWKQELYRKNDQNQQQEDRSDFLFGLSHSLPSFLSSTRIRTKEITAITIKNRNAPADPKPSLEYVIAVL